MAIAHMIFRCPRSSTVALGPRGPRSNSMCSAFGASLLVLAAVASPVGADDRGFFGFALRTDFDGSFWSPVLASASISLVAPDSPSAKSGIAPGDALIEIEGLAVKGATGEHLKKIKAILEKDARAGDRLQLKLRRESGQEYSVILVAEPRKQ